MPRCCNYRCTQLYPTSMTTLNKMNFFLVKFRWLWIHFNSSNFLTSIYFKNHYYNYLIFKKLPFWVVRKLIMRHLLKQMALTFRTHRALWVLKHTKKIHQHFPSQNLLTLPNWKPNLIFIFAMRSFTLPKVSGSVFHRSAAEWPCQISLFITTSVLFSGWIRERQEKRGWRYRLGQGAGRN